MTRMKVVTLNKWTTKSVVKASIRFRLFAFLQALNNASKDLRERILKTKRSRRDILGLVDSKLNQTGLIRRRLTREEILGSLGRFLC